MDLQLCGLQVWCWLVSTVLWLVVVELQLDLSFMTARLRGVEVERCSVEVVLLNPPLAVLYPFEDFGPIAGGGLGYGAILGINIHGHYTSYAPSEAQLAEPEKKLTVEKDLRANEAERAGKAEGNANKAPKAKKESHEADLRALKETKASIPQMLADEGRRVVTEYCESNELKPEVVKLFREGYDFCLGH
ncbi:hypothetical protein Taro_044369, partial [Colocasia esculenta]|nr:hypothetical protein [Colocasia esculenta]